MVLGHRAQCVLDRIVSADRNGPSVALTQLARLGGGGVLAFGNDLHDDVAVGDHALESVVIAADRQRTDALLGQALRGFENAVVLRHTAAVRGHDLACCLCHVASDHGILRVE